MCFTADQLYSYAPNVYCVEKSFSPDYRLESEPEDPFNYELTFFPTSTEHFAGHCLVGRQ